MTDMPAIRITVDRKQALTTQQAADRHGMETVTMRGELRRHEVKPVAHLDSRTPLYLATEVDRMVRSRPGRGKRVSAASV